MNVLDIEDLREIVEGVWMTVLRLPVLPSSENIVEGESFITSQVAISGAWEGYVQVRAAKDFLTYAAAHVFMKEAREVDYIDRKDTATELTNMIGGTIKVLLPESCDLSLPFIVPEPDVDTQLDWVGFSCNSYPLAIVMVESAKSDSQAA